MIVMNVKSSLNLSPFYLKLLFILIFFTYGCSDKGVYFEDAYCIRNVSIINPGEGLITGINVVIQGNRITHLDKAENLVLSDRNHIINGEGKFILPGLWDSHVHFYFDPYLGRYMPNLFLASGITSVRDTGGDILFMDSIKQRSLQNPKTYPRVKIAGPLIDGKYNVYDGKTIAELSIQTTDAEDTRIKTEKLVAQGVDFLKAYEMLSEDQFRVVAEIAKKYNLRMAGHVPLSMDIITATDLGLNSLEHIKNLELTASGSKDSLLKVRRQILQNEMNLPGIRLREKIHTAQKQFAINTIDRTELENIYRAMIKNNSFQVPTLSIYKVPTYKIFRTPFWRESLRALPSKTREQWEVSIQNSNDEINVNQKKFSDWIQTTTKEIHQHKIPIMAGTDTPLGFLTPGFSLHYELELLVESGLSELEALTAATLNPAIYFNMQDSLGLVKKDFIADLILVEKNPLEDIAHTRTIYGVFKDGNFFTRHQLDSMVNTNK
jgi:imidazolonepropionase-like amidohydrolase